MPNVWHRKRQFLHTFYHFLCYFCIQSRMYIVSDIQRRKELGLGLPQNHARFRWRHLRQWKKGQISNSDKGAIFPRFHPTKTAQLKSKPGGFVIPPYYCENAERIYRIKPCEDYVWLLTFPKSGTVRFYTHCCACLAYLDSLGLLSYCGKSFTIVTQKKRPNCPFTYLASGEVSLLQ